MCLLDVTSLRASIDNGIVTYDIELQPSLLLLNTSQRVRRLFDFVQSRLQVSGLVVECNSGNLAQLRGLLCALDAFVQSNAN